MRSCRVIYIMCIIEEEITGDVLLEMTPDLLKELGISTFGKRFRLHSAIKMLRDRMPSIEEMVKYPCQRW